MTMTIHSAANNSNAASPSAGIAAAGGRPAGDDLSSTNPATAPAPRNQANAANAANATVTAKAAAPATSPLFAHVLGYANGAANTIDAARTAADDTAADADQAQSDASSTADAGALLPAMAGSLFTAAMPALAPAPAASLLIQSKAAGATGTTGDDNPTAREARGDTLAVSTLYAAATPFNLSAAGVAVTTATGAAPATRYDASQDANQLALAQQAQRLADGAAAPAAFGATPTGAAAQPSDTGAVATTAGPLAIVANAANAATMALAAAAVPVAAARPAIPASPAPAAKPASAASAVVEVALPRVAVRVAAAPLDAAVAPGTNTASQTGAARDDGQGSGKFASALAGAGTAPAGLVTAAPTATAANAAVVKLAGAPEQWQQPLRDALGDRLQVNLQRNNDHAVIRLDPPNMGSIEISIRHTAGALQVNLSASNSEVIRQLNAIGDSVRQDLSNRQFTEVAVTVSSARAQGQSQADGGRQQREQQEQERDRTPGRALSGDDVTNTFAMNDQE